MWIDWSEKTTSTERTTAVAESGELCASLEVRYITGVLYIVHMSCSCTAACTITDGNGTTTFHFNLTALAVTQTQQPQNPQGLPMFVM